MRDCHLLAILPTLAGIPERVGFFGEGRFGLLNRMRWGENKLPRFIDKNAALALPDGATPATRARLAEMFGGAELSRFW